jgi:hypothetical protein
MQEELSKLLEEAEAQHEKLICASLQEGTDFPGIGV